MIMHARRPTRLILKTALLVALTCFGTPVVSADRPSPDVSGQWTWNESVIFTGPGFIVAAAFDVQVEGPVMHVRCHAWGGLAIQQTGTAFSGSADQQWACVTGGGQVALTAPFPPGFAITGSITGQAVHFTADLGQGFSCSYAGSLGVANGVATSLNATGGCDIPADFHPNMNKSISFTAVRQ